MLSYQNDLCPYPYSEWVRRKLMRVGQLFSCSTELQINIVYLIVVFFFNPE